MLLGGCEGGRQTFLLGFAKLLHLLHNINVNYVQKCQIERITLQIMPYKANTDRKYPCQDKAIIGHDYCLMWVCGTKYDKCEDPESWNN